MDAKQGFINIHEQWHANPTPTLSKLNDFWGEVFGVSEPAVEWLDYREAWRLMKSELAGVQLSTNTGCDICGWDLGDDVFSNLRDFFYAQVVQGRRYGQVDVVESWLGSIKGEALDKDFVIVNGEEYPSQIVIDVINQVLEN